MSKFYKKNIGFLFTLLLLSFSLAACAGKQNTAKILAPIPPISTSDALTASELKEEPKMEHIKPSEQKNQTKEAEQDNTEEKIIIHGISYAEETEEQYVIVHSYSDPAEKAKENESQALSSLLEMEGTQDKEDTAVMRMRPKAIREAAQLVTFQTAMAWRYKQLLVATEKHSAIMDTVFNFAPLLMTHGDTLIMPPVLTKAGASIRFETGETVTTAKTTYKLLEPARYIATVPNWRAFLMVDNFPKPEKPNPVLLPQNAEERAIWRRAVREAWGQGLSEADNLYADNVARMTRTYRGIMLYHLLAAQHLLSHVNIASADMGLHTTDKGNKLHIGQKVYRITAPSRFTPDIKDVGNE